MEAPETAAQALGLTTVQPDLLHLQQAQQQQQQAAANRILFLVVVSGADLDTLEDPRPTGPRYTRDSLRNLLQLLGCKPRLAYKVMLAVFQAVDTAVTTARQQRISRKTFQVHPHRNGKVYVSLTRADFMRLVCTCAAQYSYKISPSSEELKVACSLRERRRCVVVLLCGTSGSGKSTLASILAGRLGITSVVSTDSIRHMLRSFISRESSPLLWASTYQAGEFLGVGNSSSGGSNSQAHEQAMPEGERALSGYKAQCELLSDHLTQLITNCEARNQSLVCEGVHLSISSVVKLMARHPSVLPFLVYIPSEARHVERMAVRAKYMTLDPNKNRYVRYMGNIRLIQEYLVRKADKYCVPRVDNSNVDRSVGIIHLTVMSCLRRMARGEPVLDPATGRTSMLAAEYAAVLDHLQGEGDRLAAATAAAAAATGASSSHQQQQQQPLVGAAGSSPAAAAAAGASSSGSHNQQHDRAVLAAAAAGDDAGSMQQQLELLQERMQQHSMHDELSAPTLLTAAAASNVSQQEQGFAPSSSNGGHLPQGWQPPHSADKAPTARQQQQQWHQAAPQQDQEALPAEAGPKLLPSQIRNTGSKAPGAGPHAAADGTTTSSGSCGSMQAVCAADNSRHAAKAALVTVSGDAEAATTEAAPPAAAAAESGRSGLPPLARQVQPAVAAANGSSNGNIMSMRSSGSSSSTSRPVATAAGGMGTARQPLMVCACAAGAAASLPAPTRGLCQHSLPLQQQQQQLMQQQEQAQQLKTGVNCSNRASGSAGTCMQASTSSGVAAVQKQHQQQHQQQHQGDLTLQNGVATANGQTEAQPPAYGSSSSRAGSGVQLGGLQQQQQLSMAHADGSSSGSVGKDEHPQRQQQQEEEAEEDWEQQQEPVQQQQRGQQQQLGGMPGGAQHQHSHHDHHQRQHQQQRHQQQQGDVYDDDALDLVSSGEELDGLGELGSSDNEAERFIQEYGSVYESTTCDEHDEYDEHEGSGGLRAWNAGMARALWPSYSHVYAPNSNSSSSGGGLGGLGASTSGSGSSSRSGPQQAAAGGGGGGGRAGSNAAAAGLLRLSPRSTAAMDAAGLAAGGGVAAPAAFGAAGGPRLPTVFEYTQQHHQQQEKEHEHAHEQDGGDLGSSPTVHSTQTLLSPSAAGATAARELAHRQPPVRPRRSRSSSGSGRVRHAARHVVAAAAGSSSSNSGAADGGAAGSSKG